MEFVRFPPPYLMLSIAQGSKFFSDTPIVGAVPYVPPGRDATVSWYGPDFSFKNKYNQPILIQAKAQFGMMMILLFSSDEIDFKPKHVPSTNNKLPPETERKKHLLNEETN